jgi:hypothetical protein
MTAHERKIMETALAPRPAWSIRSVGLPGEFYGTVPRGYANTADAAVAWYLAHNPRCTVPADRLRAFPKDEGRAA